MSKVHSSLSPIVNLGLIVLWGVLAGTLFLGVPGISPVMGIIGGVLGAIGGAMQHASLRQGINEFGAASSLLEVRRVLKSTKWGRRYLGWRYFSEAVLVVAAFFLSHQSLMPGVLGYLAGYFSLMFVREIVTLRDVFFLSRLSFS